MVLNNSDLFMDNQKKYSGDENWEARQGWLANNGIKTFQDLLNYLETKEGTDSTNYKAIDAAVEIIVNG